MEKEVERGLNFLTWLLIILATGCVVLIQLKREVRDVKERVMYIERLLEGDKQ